MFALFLCLKDDHDPRLLLLSAIICVTSALAAVLLLRQARYTARDTSSGWMIAAALSSGFGVWATHFVAMQGYRPGAVLGYHIGPTLLSLLIAMIGSLYGFRLALRSRTTGRRYLAGAIVGLSFAAMHYIGISAVRLPGTVSYSPVYLLVSILCVTAALMPTPDIALKGQGGASIARATLLFFLGIFLVHFLGMTAIQLTPGREEGFTAIISPMTLSLIIGGLAFSILISALIAVMVGGNARTLIAAQKRELETLVQGITDCALYMLDADGEIVSWNAGAQRLKGYSAAEAIGLNFSTFYGIDDRATGLPYRALAQARANGIFTAEGWRYRKDGSRFWADVTIEPVVDENDGFIGFAKITRDVSLRRASQENLLSITQKLDAALSNMRQGLVLLSVDDLVVLVNARFRSLYRFPDDLDPVGMAFPDFLRTTLTVRGGVAVTDERIAMARRWRDVCLAQPGGGGTATFSYDDGNVVDITYQALPEGGVVVTFDDVTDRHASAERIAHMALHDDLTDLPNRMHFNDRVDEAMARAATDGTHVAIVAIDLDKFKEINDNHGHLGGDQVLKTIAGRLVAGLAPNELVARFGGDEFMGCCEFRSEAELDAFSRRLLAAFDEPIEVDGIEIRLSASLGIAVFPGDGSERDELYGNADLAMYRAKSTDDMHLCRYDAEMDESARARRIMAKDLREALARDEFRLAFQIQRSVTTGAATGYEALIRWEHPENGWVSPQDFIPVAEETGSIVAIGEWALREACRQAMAWDVPHRVAVNLSPVQLCRADLIARVTAILAETGLPANRLELEITETAIISDKSTALTALRGLRELGVMIAIDDFGTGYSSLESLNSFPFDKIKIDRSFVMMAERNEQARTIVRAVIALGTNLGMPVLAEGVETESQLALLRSEGCAEAQGYLFGHPTFDPFDQQKAA